MFVLFLNINNVYTTWSNIRLYCDNSFQTIQFTLSKTILEYQKDSLQAMTLQQNHTYVTGIPLPDLQMSVKHMLKQNQDIYGFICIDRTIMTVLGNIYPRAYNLLYKQ
jgi:hypothetical protein